VVNVDHALVVAVAVAVDLVARVVQVLREPRVQLVVLAEMEVLHLVLHPDRKEVVVLVVAQHHRVEHVAMVHARALVAEAKTRGEVRVAVAVI
jgi:hypothetical protein